MTAEDAPSAGDPLHWSAPLSSTEPLWFARTGVAAVAFQPFQSSTTFPDLPLRTTSNASA